MFPCYPERMRGGDEQAEAGSGGEQVGQGCAFLRQAREAGERKEQFALGVKGAQLRLGKVLAGTIDIQADEEKVTAFSGKLVATIKGLNQGELALTRTADGQTSITGKLALALTSNAKNVKGEVELTWAGDQLSGKGVAAYQGDKFNGSVTFKVMEQEQAKRLSAERKAPEKTEQQQAPAKKQRKAQPGAYVVFGEMVRVEQKSLEYHQKTKSRMLQRDNTTM